MGVPIQTHPSQYSTIKGGKELLETHLPLWDVNQWGHVNEEGISRKCVSERGQYTSDVNWGMPMGEMPMRETPNGEGSSKKYVNQFNTWHME